MKKCGICIISFLLIIILLAVGACSANVSNPESPEPSKGYPDDVSSDIIFNEVSSLKIIYSVTASLSTNDITAAIEKVKQLLPDGSWSDSEELYSNSAYYSFRVKTSMLDAFVSSLDQAGKVTYLHKSSTNITNNYSSLESTKASLEAELLRLNELQALAGSVKDLLEISARMTTVVSQLNDINKSLNNYNSLIDYSVVIVRINGTTPVEEQTFGERIVSTFKAAWEGVVAFLSFIVLALTAIVPFLVVIIPIVGISIYLYYLLKRKNNKDKNKRDK